MPAKSIVRAGLVAIAASAVKAAPTASSCSAPGSNIISNPGFESSKTSISPWTDNGVGKFKVVQPGDASNNALSVSDDVSYGKGEAYLAQAVTTKCPVDHFLSFDYKFSKPGSELSGVVVSALASNYGIEIYRESNTTWTTFSEYATNIGSADTSFNIDLYPSQSDVGNGLDILFDNFKLFPAGSPVVKSGATNKVTNGGFESGKLGPWKQSSGESNIAVVSPGLNGSKHAAKVGTSVYDSVLEQNVTLTKGSHYLLTFDYSYPKAATDESSLSISLRTDGGKENSLGGTVDSYYAYDVAQKGQHSFERRIVAHSETTLLTLEFNYGMSQQSTIGPLTIDNISLKEIEAPKMA